MDGLIRRRYLFEKITELENEARERIRKVHLGSAEYQRYMEQLNERSLMKKMILMAPAVSDTNVGCKWIPIGQYPTEPSLLCFEDGEMCVGYYDYEEWQVVCGSNIYFDGEPIAWMPLPEPYKGE